MNLGSKTPRRKSLRRRLLITALLCLSLSLLLLALAGTTASREKGLRLGSTTYTVEFDRDASQDEWVRFGFWENATSSHRTVWVRLPGGVLTIISAYMPEKSFRKRLPRDVPSLTKRLASQNRFEVKVAAYLLAESKSNAVPALPALFAAWANDIDLRLDEEIITIVLAAPAQSAEPLIGLLSSTNAYMPAFSARLLGVLGTNALSAAGPLRAAFNTNTVDKALFARAYFKITGECSEMIPQVRQILRSGESREIQRAFGFLQQVGLAGAAAIPEVLDILHADPPSDLKGVALLTLSRICDDKPFVLSSILPVLANTPESNRIWRHNALHALANLGTIGLPHLMDEFKNSNSTDHAWAAQALVGMGPAAARYIDDFRGELRSDDPERAARACEIISGLGTNALPALPELTSLLQSKDRKTHAYSAAALIRLNHNDENALVVLAHAHASEEIFFNEFCARTLIELLNNSEQSRALVKNRLARDPGSGQRFGEQICRWRRVEKSWGMETFHLQLESQVIEDLLRSIGHKPEY